MTAKPIPDVSTIEELSRGWQERGIRHVVFELPDMHGMARSKIVPLSRWEQFARDGLRMIGVMTTVDSGTNLVPGTYQSEERNYGDAVLRPDLTTAAVVPWLDASARVICDAFWPDGSPVESAPRYVLRRVLERLAALGYRAHTAIEYEFYLFQDLLSKEPVFDRLHIFHTQRNVACPVPLQIMDLLPELGLQMLTCNCEYGPGQYEITYDAEDALTAGDYGYTFKNGVKMIARRLGYHATFMTRPFLDQSSSGAHVHLSLRDANGRNAFLDTNDRHGLSSLAYHFIGGLIQHMPGALALLAPTPNCYRRYLHHSFAPVNLSWGLDDRTALIRVKNTGDAGTHVENRAPSSMSNPYLALAATVAAGLLGLEEEAVPPALAEGPAEEHEAFAPLPATLEEALQHLEADTALRDLLGMQFTEIFIKTKRQELERRGDYVRQRLQAAELEWEEQEYLADF
ncbi:MAG: glutamine synthetase [Thermogemmatispora sp.]|jgi:glutamine synthetase|uniref:glutamine synthetase n=1 Tax=Thermogemmatispora aurantia TaxID=2045279 RepID=A0A5J4K165_9CHLR|nr:MULTISPECIES: glutamine synthetase family protein [Thermogemmatispora]MBE3567727.1 glutamine synthetase [Thermogemmatispora sp.]GER82828.1 glutamine synthetase [Thermogemmatispora aurantia]